MKVLFVDDEPRVLSAIRRTLSDEAGGPWQIDTAPSGPEALALLEDGHFDVIVTDARMPGMDGATLLSYVAERWPSITRIVLSGQTDQESAMKAIGSAHQYLSKPCSPKKLTEIVENAYYLKVLTPNSRIRDIAAAVDKLPAMPKIHERVLRIIDSPNGSAREAAELIQRDPGLCAKILRVVNSAAFARGVVVRDIGTATSRVGLDMLRSLVLTDRVANGMAGERVEEVQRASVKAAVLASHMLPPDEQRTGYTAALLCDVGTLVLEQAAPQECEALRGYANLNNIPLYAAEKQFLGSSHAEVAGYVLGLWGVPSVIVDAVVGHHELPAEASLLTAVVHVAHAIVAGAEVSEEAAVRAGIGARVEELRQAFLEDKFAA